MDQNAAGGSQDRRRRGPADAVDPQDHGFMYGWSFYDAGAESRDRVSEPDKEERR